MQNTDKTVTSQNAANLEHIENAFKLLEQSAPTEQLSNEILRLAENYYRGIASTKAA
ncbi:hypothetical protein VCHA34P129_40200 [Vibrio chagasii]|nr:hypothetical protein VCHA34P129_40200 [Vibrio chagasii]CAH7305118.1 hypothetical protein VCHA52P455_40199 [Vibrio chagasii]